MKIPDFETFYNSLVENDLWFDGMKLKHGTAQRIREVAEIVYLEYVGNPKMFPAIENARNHVHYKLCKMPKPQAQPKPMEGPDFHTNPLTDEQRKNVDKMLSDYLASMAEGFQRVPDVADDELKIKGQERRPLIGEGRPNYFRTTDDETLRILQRKQRILRVRRYWTVKERHPELSPRECLERVNNM